MLANGNGKYVYKFWIFRHWQIEYSKTKHANFMFFGFRTHQMSLGGATSFHGMHMTQMLC
jgi:hypothetical protein